MDLLKGYSGSDDESSGDEVAPEVDTKSIIKAVSIVDPKTKQLKHNPKYEELFQPEAGPVNPFKSAAQRAPKNTLTGYIEAAHFDNFHFDREIRSFDTLGYALDPSAGAGTSYIGDKTKAEAEKGASLFDTKKTGGEKRKREINLDPADIEGFTGPWATYKDEQLIAKPDPQLQAEMDEIVKKRKKLSKAGKKEAEAEKGMAEESSTLHLKEVIDYQGRSFMQPPSYTGVNLRADAVPDRCFIPKKQIATYRGHAKNINVTRWFPKTAHMFMTCAMEPNIKLWEVYGKHQIIRTYKGHRLPVRDINFNNDGTEFLSASYDRYVKLWDTETGQVKGRFHTGHIPFCVKFNPDDDKQHFFLAGMQNKKIIQWDTRSGEIVQEYDRHLGGVNSITFFDKNRRFVSTSDDKSLRIWEWEIPVDTKLIQNAGLHSIPVMTKAPMVPEKWIVGQCMDSRIVLFQLVDDKLRFAKKKSFRGHNSAGYACQVDFSPDMSYIISGDADGKVFVWDWRTHKVVARWKAHERTCISALWHPHEKSKILTAGWDGCIKLWN